MRLAASSPREGTMAYALARAREAGIARSRLQEFFAAALIVPVLTAHPTEVRRRSTINREMEVAAAARRARPRPAHAGGGGGERGGAAPRRAHAVADQPAAAREARRDRRGRERARVLRLHVPARAAAVLCRARGSSRRYRHDLERQRSCRSFLRMGSWIGGDRDGNPFVTAEVLRQALRLQSKRALRLLSRGTAPARRRALARCAPRRSCPRT